MANIGNTPTKLVALPDDAVTTTKIQDDAVTTDKLADGAVTLDKLDPGINFNSTGATLYMASNFGGF